MTQTHLDAYRNVKNSSVDASQIVTIYDGMIRLSQQAKEAIEKKDYQTKFNALNRVHLILNSLRDCLNSEEAPEVSKVLDGFYQAMSFQILSVLGNDNTEALDEVIANIRSVRNAWQDAVATLARQEAVLTQPAEDPSAEGVSPPPSVNNAMDFNLSI